MDLSEMTNIREEWKMKHSKLALMLLVIVLALGMVSAYAETEAEPEFDGEIRIGLICPVTGTSKAIGDYQQNGFNLAMEEINAAGGILGKKVVGVIADEVDNMQSAVNAHMLLLSDDSIMGIVGSTYSVYTIAAIPQITEAGVPYIAGGSSSGITDEGSDYVWMVRPTDVYQGQVLADVAIEVLGMQNPAIMYSTQSSLMALQERLVAALQERGIEVDPGNLYGFPEEEQNYAPIFAQIQNSDADGLICLTNVLPASIICQQFEIAGIDLPHMGQTSYSGAVCRENAGSAADGWYSVADWTPEVTEGVAKHFEDAYRAKYGAASDLGAVCAYDGLYLLKAACEIANTTTDREAINNALYEISELEGAISTYTYLGDHNLNTSLYVTRNEDGLAVMIDKITYR